MRKEIVLELLKSEPGLTDREITDRLMGRGQPSQPVNSCCRELAEFGQIRRIKIPGSPTRNYLGNGVSTSQDKGKLKSRPASARELPIEVRNRIKEAGEIWALSEERQSIDPETRKHWDCLIDEWAEDFEMPLVIRKSTSVRGSVHVHISGRRLIWADNSPAQWAYYRALQGFRPMLPDIRSLLLEHKIPFAFAISKSNETSLEYKGTTQSCGVLLNKDGWKLCHIEDVSSRGRGHVDCLDLGELKSHFRRLMKPSNQFLVPKKWWGFGELPEVIDAIRAIECTGH